MPTATTNVIACPTCGTSLAISGTGHITCPKCGQRIEVGRDEPEPQVTIPMRARKLNVSNGFGWWTAIYAVAFLFFLIPGVPMVLFAGFCLFMGFTEKGGADAGYGVAAALMFGIPGLILSMVGYGLNKWAESGSRTLVCGVCRNPTTKHAVLCPSCSASFM